MVNNLRQGTEPPTTYFQDPKTKFYTSKKSVIEYVLARERLGKKKKSSSEDIEQLEKLRNRVIEEYLPMIIRIARKFRKSNVDDLIQEGVITLMQVMKKYDPRKGGLGIYAEPSLKTRMRDYDARSNIILSVKPYFCHAANKAWYSTKNLSSETPMSLHKKTGIPISLAKLVLETPIIDIRNNNPETGRVIDQLSDTLCESHKNSVIEEIHNSELGRIISAQMVELPLREERVLRRRFYKHDTLQQIADEWGISRERVRQIEQRALRRLKKKLIVKGLRLEALLE